MRTDMSGQNVRTAKTWRRCCLTVLAGLMGFAGAAFANGACPERPSTPYDPDDYEALLDEIYATGHVYKTELSVGDQEVWRLRRRSAQHRPDSLLSMLNSLKPRLEEMQSHFPTSPSRPVLLIESRLDGFGSTLAFTDCASPGAEGAAAEEARRDGSEEVRDVDLAKHVVSGLEGVPDSEGESDSEWEDELKALPEGLCLIVVFPDRLENERKRRFALAHEWMHTMQNGFYTRGAMESHWWVEGSAEWLAHKVNDGVTERDHRIEEFFMRQKTCPLTEHSYDAQPFFFWGEQAFNTAWAISVGLGGEEYLTRPGRAAEILPPERWLDWAIAQVDQTITMPDGRPLPVQAEAEPMDLTRACDAVIEGPPLSVQLREVSLPSGGDPKLRIEAGAAHLAIRGRDEEDWRRVTGTVEIDTPVSPMTVAAITPSGENLSARLSMNNSDRLTCACQIGVWMESPTPDEQADDALAGALEALEAAKSMGMVPSDEMDGLREAEAMLLAANAKDTFRFRGNIPAIVDELEGDVETTYSYDGPVLTVRPGGTFSIDDPHTTRGDDTTINYHKYRHYGRWTDGGGVLKFDIEGLILDGFVTAPPDYEPRSIGFTNESASTASYVGGGGEWRMSCEAETMTLTSTRVRNPGRSDQAVFVRR